MNYKKLVKDLRDKMILSQNEFAELLGISFTTVNRWETGRHEPTIKIKRKLVDLCKENNIDLDYCVCCEETERSLLQPVHINRKLSQWDSNNSLVLCKEHARLYFDGYFRFNKAGKILIYKQHPLLDKRMHLSHRILKLKLPYLED